MEVPYDTGFVMKMAQESTPFFRSSSNNNMQTPPRPNHRNTWNTKKLFCNVCQRSITPYCWARHLSSKRHQRMTAAISASTFTQIPSVPGSNNADPLPDTSHDCRWKNLMSDVLLRHSKLMLRYKCILIAFTDYLQSRIISDQVIFAKLQEEYNSVFTNVSNDDTVQALLQEIHESLSVGPTA